MKTTLSIYNINLHFRCKGDKEPDDSFDTSEVLAINAEDAIEFAKDKLYKWLVGKKKGQGKAKPEDIEHITLNECRLMHEDILNVTDKAIQFMATP